MSNSKKKVVSATAGNNKFYYIKRWAIALLFRFVQNDAPITISYSSTAIVSDNPYISEFDALISNLQTFKINNEEQFRLNEIGENIYELSPIGSKEHIYSLLKEYYTAYMNEILDYYRDEDLPYPYQIELRNFKNIVNTNFSLKKYRIESSKYLNVILAGYFNGNVDISNYEVEFPLEEKYGRDAVYIVEGFYNDDRDYPKLKEDFLDIFIEADISHLFKKSNPDKENDLISNINDAKKINNIKNDKKNASSNKSDLKGKLKTLKLFLELAHKKLKNGEYFISYTEIHETRVYPNKRFSISEDNLSQKVSNRISKVRPLFKKLSNSSNGLFKTNNDDDYNYEIVASMEQIQMALEKIDEILG